MAKSLLELFFPQDNACLLCARSLWKEEHLLCKRCAGHLHGLEIPAADALSAADGMELCLSAFYHADEASHLVHLLKYDHVAIAAEPLAEAMIKTLQSSAWVKSFHAIIPVPVHEKRLQERGYNQAELLAAPVAKSLGMPLSSSALSRLDSGKSQVGANRNERLQKNIKDFRADPAQVNGKTILLIDDVLTTGATAKACAEALHIAGAERVYLLTACRA